MNEQNFTPAQVDFFDSVRRFVAKYRGQLVEVRPESLTDDRRITVRGDFGQEWTNGGWAEIVSKIVPLNELSELVAELTDGTQVHPKGSVK